MFQSYTVTVTIDLVLVSIVILSVVIGFVGFKTFKKSENKKRREYRNDYNQPPIQESSSNSDVKPSSPSIVQSPQEETHPDPLPPVQSNPDVTDRKYTTPTASRGQFTKLQLSEIPEAAGGTAEDPIDISTPRSKAPSSIGSIDTSVNTTNDLDEFMVRLYKKYFIINRIKDNGKDLKKRVMKFNNDCELCLYKKFSEKKVNNPKNPSFNYTTIKAVGSPYMKIPLKDLLKCVPCDEELPVNKKNKLTTTTTTSVGTGHVSFFLEFKKKMLQLQAPLPLHNTYLINGFQQLINRMKFDKTVLDQWKVKYTELQRSSYARGYNINSGNVSNSHSYENLASLTNYNEDDDQSAYTANTANVHPDNENYDSDGNYLSERDDGGETELDDDEKTPHKPVSQPEVEDIDTKLRKRASQRNANLIPDDGHDGNSHSS